MDTLTTESNKVDLLSYMCAQKKGLTLMQYRERKAYTDAKTLDEAKKYGYVINEAEDISEVKEIIYEGRVLTEKASPEEYDQFAAHIRGKKPFVAHRPLSRDEVKDILERAKPACEYLTEVRRAIIESDLETSRANINQTITALPVREIIDRVEPGFQRIVPPAPASGLPPPTPLP